MSRCRGPRNGCGARSSSTRRRWPRIREGRGPMYEFDYVKAASLDDAAKRLANEDAKLVAGGMTLIPTLKFRLAKPAELVDLGGLGNLKGVSEDGNAVVIGAMTRH